MRRVAVVAVLLAVAAPAGAGTRSRSSQTGVVDGVVTRGPTCSKGMLHPCAAPLPDIRIVFVRHSRPAAQTTTDAAGIYRIRLSAGRYAIRLPGHDRWRPTEVSVVRGRIAHVDIAIDALDG